MTKGVIRNTSPISFRLVDNRSQNSKKSKFFLIL